MTKTTGGGKRGKYKLYKTDPSKNIPRTTMYRIRKKAGFVKARRKKCTKPLPVDRNDVNAEKRKRGVLISIMSLMENHTGVTKSLMSDFLKVIGICMDGEPPRHLQSLYKFYKEKKVSHVVLS